MTPRQAEREFRRLKNQQNRKRRERNVAVWEEGRQAALAGRHRQTNPYFGSTLFVHWAEGHERGTQEKNECRSD